MAAPADPYQTGDLNQFAFSYDTSARPHPLGGALDASRLAGGWPGAQAARGSDAEQELTRERAKAGPMTRLPWFLPFFDAEQTLSENAQMRSAYRRMLANHAVKAALLQKIISVCALGLKVIPAKAPKRNKELQMKYGREADFLRWALTDGLEGGVPGLIWSVLSGGLIDGYSLCEKVWAREEAGEWGGLYHVRTLKPKDVGKDLILETDEYRNVTSVRGMRYNAGQYFHPAHFIYYRHLPLFDVPTGHSDLRAAYGPWWRLDTVEKLRIVHLERRSGGMLVGTFGVATQRSAMEDVLAQARAASWAAIPEGEKIELLNIAGGAEGVFQEATKDYVHQIFLAVAGAMLQQLEGSLSDARGDSQVHQTSSELRVWHLSGDVESLLNDRRSGLAKDLIDLNFVTDSYPKVRLAASDVNEQKAELEVDEKLWSMGVALSLESIRDRYDREPPDPDDPDDELKKDAGGGGEGQQPPGAPGQPPPPDGGQPEPPDGGGGGLADLLGGGGADQQFDEGGDWDEGKHPRAADGKFGKGGGGGGAAAAAKEAPEKGAPTDKKKEGTPPSKAKATIAPGKNEKKTAALVKKYLGKDGLDKAPSMVGAPDDAVVSVEVDRTGHHLWVTVEHPAFAQPMKRRISHDGRQLYVKNEIIQLKPSAQGSGIGTEIFARQVEWAARHGAGYVECHAARLDANGDPSFNGYLTWPRLGYDGYLEQDRYETPSDEARAKEAVAKFGVERVQDLMATPEGREWWKKNGYGLAEAKFDLKEGGRSRQVLDAYLEERAAKKKAAATAMSEAGGVEDDDAADGGGREEIGLSEEEEEALERAWQRLTREREDEWESFSSEDWEPYQGKRGGKGWKNTKTGRIVYGGARPGGERQPKAVEGGKKEAEPKPKGKGDLDLRDRLAGDPEAYARAKEALAEMVQGESESFADEGDWQPYEGPRGGKGWKRGDEIVYGDRPDGDRSTVAGPPKQPHPDSDQAFEMRVHGLTFERPDQPRFNSRERLAAEAAAVEGLSRLGDLAVTYKPTTGATWFFLGDHSIRFGRSKGGHFYLGEYELGDEPTADELTYAAIRATSGRGGKRDVKRLGLEEVGKRVEAAQSPARTAETLNSIGMTIDPQDLFDYPEGEDGEEPPEHRRLRDALDDAIHYKGRDVDEMAALVAEVEAATKGVAAGLGRAEAKTIAVWAKSVWKKLEAARGGKSAPTLDARAAERGEYPDQEASRATTHAGPPVREADDA